MEHFGGQQVSSARQTADDSIFFQEDVKPAKLQCGSELKGNYDTSAHIFALILILVLSISACGVPLLSRKASKSGQGKFIFLSQHFGTGVLIATAFVHLLPTGFISLTDPCLSTFFNKVYPSLPGLIAMISIFIVVAIEMFVMTSGARHSHSHTHGEPLSSIQGQEPSRGIASEAPKESFKEDRGLKEFPTTTSHCASKNLHASSRLLSVSLIPRSTDDVVSHNKNIQSSGNKEDVEDDLDETCQIEIPLGDERSNNIFMDADRLSESTSEAHQKRMMIQCFMLEAAIIFHSIFIGMALSVATGPPFIVLLIAIGFHQIFEGLALGSRIAAIQFSPRSLRPWFMVLAYGITTPIGQAIGLVLHNLYDPQSAAGLLMVGFMNAISSGLLIYAGLVQLLAEDLLSEKSMETLNGRRRIEAFGSVIIGALLMALVGAWA